MQNIWIFTELYFPDRTSTAYFLTEIAQGLATHYNVSVIAGNTLYENQHVTLANRDRINGVEIQRCRGTNFNKNRLSGKIFNGITRSLAIFTKAIWQCERSDVILVVTNPPLLPVIALLLKLVKGCRFVLLVHDVYPEVLVASGLTKPQSLLYQTINLLNRIVYCQANRIITLGRDMTHLVSAKLPQEKHQIIRSIPNWAETEDIYPLKTFSSLLNTLNLTDKFVILYAGNMGRTHDLQILLDSAKVLAKEASRVHFLCIGSGARKPWLEDQVKSQGLTNITVMSYLPHSEKNQVLNACNIGIISFLPNMAGVSVPSRMYNQMAAGKPLIAIADDWSELATVVQEEQIGWVIAPGNTNHLVQVLKEAVQNPQSCTNMGQKASEVIQRKYTLSHAQSTYRKLFEELFDLTTDDSILPITHRFKR